MAADLRIWLLGGFRAAIGSEAVPADAWRRNRARAIVKLLAMAPGHRLHREELLDTLWPGLDAEGAGANLRKALHFARRTLAPEHLTLRDDIVGLEAPGLWIDVEAFELAAGAGDLAAAIELYSGDLLPEDRFEPWTGELRERLRSRFGHLLLLRARELEGRGDRRGAAAALERLVGLDPLHEDAHGALVRLHALAGERHLALRRYRELEARLRDELGVEPGPELRRLRDDVVAGAFGPAAPPVLPAPPVASGPASADGPPPAEAGGAEERKLVTVLFADLAGGGSREPERARRMADSWAALVSGLVETWGGTAERQVGSSVTGVFGVPAVHEDDPGRALRAALEIVERSPLPVRVGVSTGEVIAPSGIGAGLRDVAGAALDAAARLREVAPPGTIMAAERTCRAAGAGFRLGEPVELALPGFAGRVAARRVKAAEPAPAPQPVRLGAPLVGRQPELAMILSLVDDVLETRRPRLLNVLGPAGVGKSRLIREAVAAVVERQPGTRVLRGRCLSAGQGITYWALAEILRDACGVALGEAAEVTEARLRSGLRPILERAGLAGAEVDATIFALATTAGIGLAGNPLDAARADAVASEAGRAWPRLASGCAAGGLAVIVVEDLHWAGDALLRMLERIVQRSEGPLLVIGTARPELLEAQPGFGAGAEDFAAISLRPLPQTQSRELLEYLLAAGQLMEGRQGLPEARRVDVLARAEGNPFFLEELLLHLADDRAGALPDTLQALLAARIDSLQLREKRTLQEAAVVGRVFWAEPIARALPGEAVPELLHELERRGFIVERTGSSVPGRPEYLFRHALIHDVAYGSLPAARRARAHAGVGAWLEEIAGSRDELVELLAHHYGAAAGGEDGALAWPSPELRQAARRMAFEHLVRAGAAARRRSATVKAVDLHTQALDLAAGPDERLAVLEELGDDHESVFRGDESALRYGEALEIARVSPPTAEARARLCGKLAGQMALSPGAFGSNPDPAVAERLIAEGLSITRDDANRAQLLVARAGCARLYRGSEPFGQGEDLDPVPIEERIAAASEAREIGVRLGMGAVIGAAEGVLGLLYGLAGRYGDILEHSRRQLVLLDEAPSRLERAEILRVAAVRLVTISADYEEGLELARRCYTLSRETSPHHLMHATWPLLAAMYHLGRWQELLPVLEEHVAAFREEPATECQFVRDGPVIGAVVLTHMGKADRAAALAALVGDARADRSSASAWQSWYAVVSGDPATARTISADKALEGRLYGPQHALSLLEALVASEDWEALAEFLPRARLEVAGNALLLPFCDRAEGRLLARGGASEAAAQSLLRALSGFERLAVPFEAALTREALAGLGPAAPARALLADACAAFAALGAAPLESNARARLQALVSSEW